MWVPTFDDISQFTADMLLLPVSVNKQTHIEILLPALTLTFSRHRHVILHPSTKFDPNWTIGDVVVSCGVMSIF